MEEKPRVALFIDAENTAASHLPAILAAAKGLGRITIARCYGNEDSLKGWKAAIADHHLRPMLTPASTGKQNASDFALTIDAVALLHRDLLDHALIVSSDADFAPLAAHIREHGKGISCYGDGKKLRGSYRNVFDHVFESVPSAAAKPAPATSTGSATKSQTPKPSGIPAETVRKLIAHYKEFSESGKPLTIQYFGTHLGKLMPKDYRKGHGTLANYLKKTGAFVITEGKQLTLSAK